MGTPSKRALIGPDSWPSTNISSPIFERSKLSTTCSRIVELPKANNCLVLPIRLDSPAARTMPEITSSLYPATAPGSRQTTITHDHPCIHRQRRAFCPATIQVPLQTQTPAAVERPHRVAPTADG